GEETAAENGNARTALQAAMQSTAAISNASRRGTQGKCPERPDDADAGPAEIHAVLCLFAGRPWLGGLARLKRRLERYLCSRFSCGLGFCLAARSGLGFPKARLERIHQVDDI